MDSSVAAWTGAGWAAAAGAAAATASAARTGAAGWAGRGRECEWSWNGGVCAVGGPGFEGGGEILADPMGLEGVGRTDSQDRGFLVEVERHRGPDQGIDLLWGESLFQPLEAGLPEFF